MFPKKLPHNHTPYIKIFYVKLNSITVAFDTLLIEVDKLHKVLIIIIGAKVNCINRWTLEWRKLTLEVPRFQMIERCIRNLSSKREIRSSVWLPESTSLLRIQRNALRILSRTLLNVPKNMWGDGKMLLVKLEWTIITETWLHRKRPDVLIQILGYVVLLKSSC